MNTAPNHLAGMASGTTNMLRDFGFTLGPAIIGAVALSQAAAGIRQQLAAHPALSDAYAAFLASPAHVPAAERPAVEGAVHAVTSGPLGANAVPATVTTPDGTVLPFNPLKHVAFDALSHSYSTRVPALRRGRPACRAARGGRAPPRGRRGPARPGGAAR